MFNLVNLKVIISTPLNLNSYYQGFGACGSLWARMVRDNGTEMQPIGL